MSAKGLEPLTNGLKGHCSTIELRARERYFITTYSGRQQVGNLLKSTTLNRQRRDWRCRSFRLAGSRRFGLQPRARMQPPMPVGRAAGIWAEDQRELIQRGHIIFAPPAKIAHPGWKIRDGNQIIPDPGVISHIVPVHLACLAFRARE